MIEFDRVNFAYGSQQIVSDFSWQIAPGDFVGILGPNGAGKSTLVRLMLGLEKPDVGTVRLAERNLSGYKRKELARRIAAVMQGETVEFPFTAFEIVLLGRIAHLGATGFESEADYACAEAAMAELGIADFRDRLFYTLSGGEKKRVLLARCFAQGSDTLVLDEPIEALDLRHQVSIFEHLRQRNGKGSTIVTVVHDLNLAATYCKTLLLCRRNQPPLIGTVTDILTYQNVKEIFGVDVYVGVNEVTGGRYFLPMAAGTDKNLSIG